MGVAMAGTCKLNAMLAIAVRAIVSFRDRFPKGGPALNQKISFPEAQLFCIIFFRVTDKT